MLTSYIFLTDRSHWLFWLFLLPVFLPSPLPFTKHWLWDLKNKNLKSIKPNDKGLGKSQDRRSNKINFRLNTKHIPISLQIWFMGMLMVGLKTAVGLLTVHITLFPLITHDFPNTVLCEFIQYIYPAVGRSISMIWFDFPILV